MEGVKEPLWVITTTDDAIQRAVDFGQLFALRDKIVTALLLWDTNSYFVQIPEKFFIINGGKRLDVRTLIGSDPAFLYTRRVSQAFNTFGGKEEVKAGNQSVQYLLGMMDKEGADAKELFLVISDCGRFWKWGNKR